MKEPEYCNWPEWLANADLPERHKTSFAITLHWYLNFCRRGRGEVNHDSARDFIAWAQAQKQPEPLGRARLRCALTFPHRFRIPGRVDAGILRRSRIKGFPVPDMGLTNALRGSQGSTESRPTRWLGAAALLCVAIAGSEHGFSR